MTNNHPSLPLRFAIAITAATLSFTLPRTSEAALCSLDVDGDGKVAATTDGLLMMRYLLGIRGAALISGALAPGAARTLPADIEAYLATPCAQAGWVAQGSGRLNDTGITSGGNPTSGNNATCTSTGANVSQQDCSKGRDVSPALNVATDGAVGFSFSKVSNAGAVLGASATLGAGPTDWGCTYDNVTGLMWEIKTVSGRRGIAHTYSWFSSDTSNNAGGSGTANGGACFDAGQCDTEKFVQQVNAAGMCGHSDWRMPHRHELQGIVHFGVSNPAIDVAWFPNTPASYCWSGSPVVTPLHAWSVAFQYGGIDVGERINPVGVRLVRAGQ